MNEELRENFKNRCITIAGEAAKYAVQRNIISFIEEIEKQTGMDESNEGNAEEYIMTIRLAVTHDKYHHAKIRVKDCFWNRKIKFVDDDFPEDDIDALQPDMFEEYEKQQEHIETDSVTKMNMRNALIEAAREMGADYYELCQNEDHPELGVEIEKHTASGDYIRKPIPEYKKAEILEAAADVGGIVVDGHGTLKKQSLIKLLKNGYNVYQNDNGSYWLLSLDLNGNILKDKCPENQNNGWLDDAIVVGNLEY